MSQASHAGVAALTSAAYWGGLLRGLFDPMVAHIDYKKSGYIP